ncbi:MAG: hypothetical protein Q8M22_08345 [Actinomycetota bacterium]|nr:hypothetical protein [Actinomycetota bacterium]
MPSPRPLVEKVLDVWLYAPVGVAKQLGIDVPAGVAQRHAQLHDRVRFARWVGEMAVTYGRQNLEQRLASAAEANPVLERVVAEPLAAAQADELTHPPFDGYDQLAAAQIVQLLGRLPHVELELIRTYEAQHRKRRTILAKVDQLLDT